MKVKIKEKKKMDNVVRFTAKFPVMLLGCLLAISACTIIPVQDRGDIPARLPQQFAGNGVITPGSIYWKQSFPSKCLQDDIETLLEANFELKAAFARVKQAAAAYGVSQSAFFPSLDARAGFDRSRIEEDKVGSSTITRNTIDFEAALQWELDIWGRVRARKKSASLSFEEQQALADQTALHLKTLLVESWITHHAAQRLEQILNEQREANVQLLNLIELHLAQGQGKALDVLQQRGHLIKIERAFPDVISRKNRAANAYAVLMGHLPDGSSLPEDEWPVLDRLSAITTPRNLLEDRPDLRAAFLALQAADQEVAAAIADRLPHLSIGLSYVASGSTFSAVGNGKVLRFTSNLLAPVFDAGRLKAMAAQRKAEAHQLLAVLEQTILEAVREVEDALVLEQTLFDEQILMEKEVATALDAVDRSRLCYINGQESFLTVLIMLAKLQTLQQESILLQQDLLINRARLLKALGAKWSEYDEKT